MVNNSDGALRAPAYRASDRATRPDEDVDGWSLRPRRSAPRWRIGPNGDRPHEDFLRAADRGRAIKSVAENTARRLHREHELQTEAQSRGGSQDRQEETRQSARDDGPFPVPGHG